MDYPKESKPIRRAFLIKSKCSKLILLVTAVSTSSCSWPRILAVFILCFCVKVPIYIYIKKVCDLCLEEADDLISEVNVKNQE